VPERKLSKVIISSGAKNLKTLKIEIGNWKFGFHAFVLLINAFNFGISFISPKFLFSNFKFQAVNDYKISPFGRNDKKRGFRSGTSYTSTTDNAVKLII
jgi:hypothetical protein